MFYALRRAAARVGRFVFIVIFLRGFCVLNKKKRQASEVRMETRRIMFFICFLFGLMFVNRAKNNGQQCQSCAADFCKDTLIQSANTA